MNALRSLAGIIVGYATFALSAFAFFHFLGIPPHAEASVGVMAGSIAVGLVGAFAGGYLAALIAGQRPLAHGIAVAAVLAAGATASLVSTLGHGAIWSQVAALVLMAPSAAAGGWVRERQVIGPGELTGRDPCGNRGSESARTH